jgi:uncharacterized membrane protein YqjE
MPDDRVHVGATVARAGLLDNLAKIVHDAGRLFVDHLELAALEAQRAADTLVRILIAAIVVTVLVVAAWMGVVAGTAIWATKAGLSLPWALLLAGGLNLAAALGIGLWIRARLPSLMFASTLRQLRGDAEAMSEESERRG